MTAYDSVELFLHNERLSSLFELQGNSENAFTYAFGLALSRSKLLLNSFLKNACSIATSEATAIRLQTSGNDGGYTDIEIEGRDFRIIVEAKIGWDLPSRKQVNRYQERFNDGRKIKKLIVLSDCDEIKATSKLKRSLREVEFQYFSWLECRSIVKHAKDKSYGHQRFLLTELALFLEVFCNMKDENSNLVYVVSIGGEKASWMPMSTRDFLLKERRYFHPHAMDGWPPNRNRPIPNYFAFRFDGKLQGIYHVDEYQIVKSIGDVFPKWGDTAKRGWPSPQVLYKLGKRIQPTTELRTGKTIVRSQRTWAALDLLLTSKTISDAVRLTKARLKSVDSD